MIIPLDSGVYLFISCVWVAFHFLSGHIVPFMLMIFNLIKNNLPLIHWDFRKKLLDNLIFYLSLPAFFLLFFFKDDPWYLFQLTSFVIYKIGFYAL